MTYDIPITEYQLSLDNHEIILRSKILNQNRLIQLVAVYNTALSPKFIIRKNGTEVYQSVNVSNIVDRYNSYKKI